jgi:hypothetical protein
MSGATVSMGYNLPNMDFRNPEGRQEYDTDVLRAFSEACREDLHV